MKIKLTESKIKNIIKESIKKVIINESQESKSIDAAKKLLISNGYTPEQADKFIRIDLRNDIPSLRDSKNGKFILGVTRMFLNRELSDATTILNIDKTIKLLALAHYNEYDRNLNGISAEELINKFADARSEQSNTKRNTLSTRQFEKRDYNIVKINSFEEASKYSQYTSWCVTHGESAFDSYTAGGEAQFYFCLKNGFENIKPIKGENCPLDEYGLSMIAVCVDGDGDLKTCTCRWNHDNGGNDNIMDEEQISNIVGVNFYQTFKPSNGLKEKVEALKGMTEIPQYYFQDSKIKEIIIPENITKINNNAFYYCTALTSVTIPDSVTFIGMSAFGHCTALTSVTIPDSVTSISSYMFYNCTSLSNFIISNSIKKIGEYAFAYCTALTSITIPNSVTYIGEIVFKGCTSLSSITIPDSVISIGDYAFSYCSSLSSITIPDSVTYIGSGAFIECTSLSRIIIGNGVTIIGNYAFYGCSKLSSITIPDGVTSIGSSAFAQCSKLSSVYTNNSYVLRNVKEFFPSSAQIFPINNKKINNENIMKKKTIKINENELKQIVTESVKRIINEFNISSAYGYRREEPKIISRKLNILDPIDKFITSNFGEDESLDFCDYLYDNKVYKPNVTIDGEYFTINDEDYKKIIECIKQYPNKEIVKTIIDSFEDIVYNYDYDNDAWETEKDDRDWDDSWDDSWERTYHG